MLFYLSQTVLALVKDTPLQGILSFLRLFNYITFRTAGAAVTALALSWWLGPRMIAWLKDSKFGQDYEDRAKEMASSRPAPRANAAPPPWAA